jgi:lysophospholipase L1-like esterase
MTSARCLCVILALALATNAFGQTPEQLAAAKKEHEEWRASRAPKLMDDFGELGHYRPANAALKLPAPGERRVVFFGDSITEGWPLAKSFPDQPYVNRGISGQTTSQMLIRFRPDVIDLKPTAVVILAGTNDIAGNTGPMSLEDIEGNLASMADLARAHGVRVIISSVLPLHNYTPESIGYFAEHPPEQIRELNRWLQAYCQSQGCIYLDYFSSMVDESGKLKKDLSGDGLHPNPAGYAVMTPLAEAAIQKALASR